jgi:hypothetical protein
MPQSLSVVYFILAIFIYYLKNDNFNILLLTIVTSMYFTHPLISLIFIIFLIIDLISNNIIFSYIKSIRKSTYYLLLFIVSIFTVNWIYLNPSFFTTYIIQNLNLQTNISQNLILPASDILLNESLLQNLDTSIALFLFIFAILLILHNKIFEKNNIIKNILKITLLLFFWFYYPFLQLISIQKIFMIWRWQIFSTFFVVIIMSISLYYFIINIKKNKRIIILIICFIYILSMISSNYTANDSPLFKTSELGTPFILNNEEIHSTIFIKNYLKNSTLITDVELEQFMTYYDSSYNPNIKSFFENNEYYTQQNISIDNLILKNIFENSYFLYRITKNNLYGLFLSFSQPPLPGLKISDNINQQLYNRDKVFDSKNIILFSIK